MFDKWAFYKAIGYGVHHPEVRRFHNSDARVKVCVAPRRTTKSYSSSYDVLPDILQKENSIGWIVGPTYELSEKEFRYVHKALIQDLGLKAKTDRPKDQLLILEGNREIRGKSADHPKSLQGEGLNWVIYSEAAELPRSIRERYIHPALNTTRGREIVPTTPGQGAEWVHELWLAGQGGKFDWIDTFQWDRRANPIYDNEEFERAKKYYGKNSAIFREQYLGEWVFYGGSVYPMWDEDLHVIPQFEIPGWSVIRAIDFGARDPFVCLWIAIGPHSELYVFDEYYERETRGLHDYAANVKAKSSGLRINSTVADPTAAQLIEDLSYEGINADPGNNDRMAGRTRVTEYLTPTYEGQPPFQWQDYTEQKWPKLYVTENCVEFRREMRYYRWKEGRKIENEKERTEGEDHAMDPLRYAVMTRPSPHREVSSLITGSFAHEMDKIRSHRLMGAYMR